MMRGSMAMSPTPIIKGIMLSPSNKSVPSMVECICKSV